MERHREIRGDLLQIFLFFIAFLVLSTFFPHFFAFFPFGHRQQMQANRVQMHGSS
jgi:hypothetical protein